MDDLRRYTLHWTHSSGMMMSHSEMAFSKEHALSKAMSDSVVNLYIFEYVEQFADRMNDIDLFFWTVDGRIC